MQKEKAIIIIPTYNEEENIANTIQNILVETDSLENYQVEVLVFDSNSQDNTVETVQNLMKHSDRVHFAYEKVKSGLGSAYLQAMHYAIDHLEADIVFEFDADGSHQPCYIAPMLEQLKSNDVVVGSRYITGGSIPKDWGWDRKILSIAGNWIARLFLTKKYKDITSGMRATRVAILKKVLPNQFLSNHYAYKLHLYWLLYKVKARIVEFPIVFIDREKGESKLPKNSIIDTLRVLFIIRLRQLKSYLMMCSVGLIGACVQITIYNLFRNWEYSIFSSTQISIAMAIMCNFILNNRITFKRDSIFQFSKLSIINRFSQYILYSIVMIYLQSLWMSYLIEIIGPGRLKENLLMAVGVGLGSIINYLFYTNVIWRNRLLN